MKSMFRAAVGASLVAAFAAPVLAQELSETDLSRYEIFEEDGSFKTLSDLQEMEDAYVALLEEGNCAAAVPAIVEYYETANQLANIMRRGNEPYYSARHDDREYVAQNRELAAELLAAERLLNGLVAKRNSAWVEEAKCLLKEGDRQAGITRLYRALDYISTDERELWEEARTLLWQEIGFKYEK